MAGGCRKVAFWTPGCVWHLLVLTRASVQAGHNTVKKGVSRIKSKLAYM